jgi:hypothetical protein
LRFFGFGEALGRAARALLKLGFMQNRSCSGLLAFVSSVIAFAAIACGGSDAPASDQEAVTKSPTSSSSSSDSAKSSSKEAPAATSSSSSSSGSSDAEPTAAVIASLPSCCDGRAKCVPNDKLTDTSSLTACTPAGASCVPTEMISKTFKPKTCKGTISLLKKDYDGVCLSTCLDIEEKDKLDQGSCSSDDVCVPCTNPLTGDPTGAPGCQ